ncbi:hypothetical protein AGABI2DRAFT_122967 [Agaricus bisporus var. bisporus H97]|uniref:hypothetical protein n=1 Tax=Agaricus bisporus var. bisporus (strain H97 / ATCC MYA-4626 / FGSC 10389) TaxID=936046 RepID=UPI00029F7C33|nr:hypothetical protein AGABI2DRAFT_122967 [Agaricus bisporus var. bisporus H97]EKV42240.1 hypothetical protein AGABI2DRAFT_122967 [Agaricus bisporus var. bisporus H97]
MARPTIFMDVPSLPDDVLRIIFETAARDDARKAVKFTLISKLVCTWVERCLYKDVKLYTEKSLQSFLRALDSSSKPKCFFATRVKSLTISYDIYNSERAARILSACRGVDNLTIWAIPSLDHVQTDHALPHYDHSLRVPDDGRAQLISSGGPPDQLRALYRVFSDHLRPKRLAILVDKPLYATIQLDWTTTTSSPDFSLGLFDNLTHLSIVNRWTDWNTWIWNQDSIASMSHDMVRYRIDNKCLPRLTHLSLEIPVAKRAFSNSFHLPSDHNSFEQPARRLAESVGLSLARILASFKLRVLLCIVTFDDSPHSTARLIREVTASNIEVLGALETLPLEPCRRKLSAKIGDPRLVFAHDRDPFREREAGSYKVWNMWERAEEIVRLQMQGQLPEACGQCLSI